MIHTHYPARHKASDAAHGGTVHSVRRTASTALYVWQKLPMFASTSRSTECEKTHVPGDSQLITTNESFCAHSTA